MKCVTFSAPSSFDEAEQNVGGGKIYGEYNKGPVKVGGEWDFDEAQENAVSLSRLVLLNLNCFRWFEIYTFSKLGDRGQTLFRSNYLS